MGWYRDEYLKSRDWKNLRDAIILYQDGICECCGEKATDVHHLLYRKIYNVTHYDLMALCRKCHEAVHFWLDSDIGREYITKVKGYVNKKAAFKLKAGIAHHVSPRGFVNFRPCFGESEKSRTRITFLSRALRKNIKKTLDKL